MRAEVTTLQCGKNSYHISAHLKSSDKSYHARYVMGTKVKKSIQYWHLSLWTCEKNVNIIACSTEPAVIHKILAHLDKQTLPDATNDTLKPPLRAPPGIAPFSDYIIQRDFDFAGAVTDVWSIKTYHHLNIQNVEVRAFTYLLVDFSTKAQFNCLSWRQLLHWFLKITYLVVVPTLYWVVTGRRKLRRLKIQLKHKSRRLMPKGKKAMTQCLHHVVYILSVHNVTNLVV